MLMVKLDIKKNKVDKINISGEFNSNNKFIYTKKRLIKKE